MNTQFGILICIGNGCQYALKPAAIYRHLEIKHKTPIALRKQVDQYIKGFPFTYNHATVPLPVDGSAPQPIIPITDRFAYRECLFKSQNRRVIRQHANKKHNKKGVADEDMFQVVRMQSWFGQKRERYWVVDESQQIVRERQAHRAAIRDAGEESEPEPNTGSGSGSDEADEIIQEIEQWKAEA